MTQHPVRAGLGEVADEALQLAQANPARATALADLVLAGAHGDPRAASVAREAKGLAAKELHDLDDAVVQLREAVAGAERAGLAVRAAQARSNLSFVLLARGETDAALTEADRAAVVLTGTEAARLQMRRALVLQRLGRLDEALAGYQRALPPLRRAGDRQWEARLLTNRGVLHTYRSSFDAAERDLRRAAELYEELGQTLAAAQVRHNLGFTAARRGDLPSALAWYDDAERSLRALGIVGWVGIADRCELLLSARLLTEARALAERAVEELERAGLDTDVAEARLTLANAALLQGDHATALTVAGVAHESFVRQQRHPWAVLARYIGLRAEWLGGARTTDLHARAAVVSEALADAGWLAASVDARLVAARTALDLERLDDAEADLAAVRSARGRGPVEIRARAWHAEALLRLAHGNRRGADAALRAGMRAVDRHRATLGAAELRVRVSGHVGELAIMGVSLAVQSGDPWRVLRWAERWRAGALLPVPVRPPPDARLTADLAALRDVVAQIDEAALAGHDTRRLLGRQMSLERAVQARSRHAPGSTSTEEAAAGAVDQVADRLGDRALLEMVRLGDDLLAVVVAGGRAHLRRLGDQRAAVSELERLRFALRRLANPQGSGAARDAAERSAAISAERLDDLLMGPVRRDVGDRPLVVVPSGALHAMPWSLLPSCRRRPVVAVPSIVLWLRATARASQPAAGRVVLVGCSSPPHAVAEVTAIGSRYPHASSLLGETATVDAVTDAIDGADLAHLACHGRFRSENPLFSSLQLADGPLTVYDLERLAAPPSLLLLSACDTGLSDVHPGDELMGFAAALLSLGTATLIASVVPVPDAATRRLMVGFHDRLRAGHTPAASLALAADDTDDGPASGAGFVCLGAG